MINEIADKTDFHFDWINWILQIHDNIIIILIFILTEYTITMYDSKTREKRCVKYLFWLDQDPEFLFFLMSRCQEKNVHWRITNSAEVCKKNYSWPYYVSLPSVQPWHFPCNLCISILSNKFIKNILCCFIADGMPHFMTIPLILPKMWITVIIFLITIHCLFQNNLLNTTYFANTRIFFRRPSSFLFQFRWFHGHYGCIHRWMSSFILIICTHLLTYQNYLIRSLLF